MTTETIIQPGGVDLYRWLAAIHVPHYNKSVSTVLSSPYGSIAGGDEDVEPHGLNMVCPSSFMNVLVQLFILSFQF